MSIGWRRATAAALAGVALLAATPGRDVKAGVDAWGRGDYRAAVTIWRPLAVAGDADAQFNLGQAYKLGRGVPVDMGLAEQWYRRAALQGHPQAEENYGLALFSAGKREEALPWLEKTSARGEPRTQYVLGAMLFNGDAVAKDWVRAYALMVRASQAGLPQAVQTRAQMDRYIPVEQRQQGLQLAQRYEADAQRPQLAGAAPPPMPAPRDTIRPVPLPPSSAAEPPPSAPFPPPRASRPMPQAPAARPEPPAEPPAPMAAANGRWRIQLGAFRDRGNADALWRRLSGSGGPLAGRQSYMVASGRLTKLQAGPFASSAEAGRACAEVRPTGTACVPVAP